MDAILDAAENYTVLKEAFGRRLTKVELDSPEAEKARAAFQRLRAPARDEEDARPPQPLPEIVEHWLAAFEGGNLDAWWRLNLDMAREPESNRYQPGAEFKGDLTALPGWGLLSEPSRDRCIAAAMSYLQKGDPHTETWLGTNTWHRPAAAGYRALRLIHKCRREALDGLAADLWARWAPIIMAFPKASMEDEDEPAAELLAMAYSHAPKVVIHTAEVLIDKDNQAHGRVFATRDLCKCWDDRLVDAISRKVKEDHSLKPEAVGDLLSEILLPQYPQAFEAAKSLATDYAICEDTRVEAAAALLDKQPDTAWEVLWPMLREDHSIGKQVFLKLAHDRDQMHTAIMAAKLEEEAIAELYLWLRRMFPIEEDPKHEGAHGVGPRESVAYFRDALLSHLRERGTDHAVAALRRIANELPNDAEWLNRVVLNADRARLKKTWRPIAPNALAELVTVREARPVDSGDQLLDAIIESLRRLEAELHGTPPAVADLWNSSDSTPKDEGDLCDYIVRHFRADLKGRGIVANREVQIRPGQETDIHVDACLAGIGSETSGVVTVIVETKGCWHKKVKTAMHTQLKDRYLRVHSCGYGLYLVGWFACDQWNAGDYRRSDTPKMSLGEAREFFKNQASDISDEMTEIRAFVLDTARRQP